MSLTDVEVGVLHPERFEDVLAPERYSDFVSAIDRAQELLAGRTVWNVNSTARGGGVAEMLRSLLAYARGAGVDTRWVVIEGNSDFFRITKRIHNHLHGAPGDDGPLGEAEAEIYERTLEPNARELIDKVDEKDIVVIHDPQPAGLIQTLVEKGVLTIWRCHVGLDMPNDLARGAWKFLMPYVRPADAFVFSRLAYAWEGLDEHKVTVIPPSIDAFSPKNQQLEEEAVTAIMAVTGLVDDHVRDRPAYTGWDGNDALVERKVELYDGGPPPPFNSRMVVQVSRWDRLKDPLGVIEGFAQYVREPEAHLVVAGPAVEAVSDDPEGVEVLEEAKVAWETLEPEVRSRIHLALLPMDDGDENAAIVNALQRRADVIVQKSIAEGFGLTVAEGMWKARPVVASRIGGIQDQVIHGITGWLLDDPTDLEEYGRAVAKLLDDEYAAAEMGEEAQLRVRDEFLGPRHLIQYVELFAKLLGAGSREQAP